MNIDSDDILTIPREPGAASAPARSGVENRQQDAGLYPLDWETTRVTLKDRRFKHTLRRPTPEQIEAREEELQSDIPIGKDGSFQMPDPTANEEIDARFYDLLAVEAEGYKGTIPAAHKAAAIQGLYLREIYVDDDADQFADEVPVTEEIGQGDEPDFTITHVMRQPTEAELKRYRRRSSNGQIKPGKRGKQRFVSRSTLANAVEHYDLWCVEIRGVTLKATPQFDQADLKNAVDKLIKRQVVSALVDAIVGGLLD